MTNSLAKSKASERKYHLSISRVEEGQSLTERKPVRESVNLYRSGILER